MGDCVKLYSAHPYIMLSILVCGTGVLIYRDYQSTIDDLKKLTSLVDNIKLVEI
jgi:hypothetical protein